MPPSARMNQVVPGPEGVCATTVIEVEIELVWAGLPLSVTFAVKLVLPVTVGAPEITPVVAASVSPDGRLPDVIDHV